MADNNITIVGNMAREPELRFTPSGQANIRFGVAVNRRWQDKQSGDWQEAVSFFDVVCWRELAENVSESLSKGARVVVTGRLEQRSYERDDGEKRSVVEIVADDVAPSLRWATAKVAKTERKGASDGGQSGGSSRQRKPAQADPPPYDDPYDSEPF